MSVALRNLNGVIDVLDNHAVVRDIAHGAAAASALQVTGERRGSARPDFDACTVRGVGHGDVAHKDVFDNVDFAGVLAERADADAVAAVANEVLHEDICAVWLEGDAVVAVVDVGVLDDDVVGAVGVPATFLIVSFSDKNHACQGKENSPISVLGGILALAVAENVNVGEDDLARVGDQSVPLWAVAELEIRDFGILGTDQTKENGS